jgi:hypothetical protein
VNRSQIASEILLVAKELMAKEPDFKVTRTVATPGGNKIDEGTVKVDGKSWPAFRVLQGGIGYVAITEPRFKIGDKLALRTGGEKVVADTKSESIVGHKTWRYTFADRGWTRDMVSYKNGTWSDWPEKTGKEDAAPHQQMLQEKRQKRTDILQQRKEKRGGRLQELVDDGTLSLGQKVKYRGGRFPHTLDGTILGFNFDKGRILLQDMNPLMNKKVWVDHVYDSNGRWLYGIT